MSCVPNGSGAGGEAGKEPAPALRAAWPGAARETGRSGLGTAGKALGLGLRGPAAPFSAWPGSADQETGMARGMERAVQLGSSLCSSLREPSRAAVSPFELPRATSFWPQGMAVATQGGRTRSEIDRSRWDGFGGLASGPPARPYSRGGRGLWSSQASTLRPHSWPPSWPRVKTLHFKVHYVCVAH